MAPSSAPRLETVSFTWQNSLDEPFIREVESHCGIEGARISTHDVPTHRRSTSKWCDAGGFSGPAQIRHDDGEADSAPGTILTGQNGDLLMGNWYDDSLQVAASLRRFQIGRAFEEALAWSKILRLPVYRILWHAAQAALPPSLTPAAIYTDRRRFIRAKER